MQTITSEREAEERALLQLRLVIAREKARVSDEGEGTMSTGEEIRPTNSLEVQNAYYSNGDVSEGGERRQELGLPPAMHVLPSANMKAGYMQTVD